MTKHDTETARLKSPYLRMRQVAWAILWLIVSMAPMRTAQASDRTFPVKLSRNERVLLEQVVCWQKLGVGVADIDARAFEANAAKANFADVKCQPHAQLKGKPLYYVAQCVRDQAQWACSRAELETLVTLRERELVMRPGTVEPTLAYETLQKISRYGYFQANLLDDALESTCNMGMGDAPDLIEVSCRRWSITVSFWCPQKNGKTPCPRVIYMVKRA
ncbi:hypothetical protein LPB67_10550 [Undibacterium sp. Jales W-56]|uniref:hypothetical protein n=1 Tax=Undibacterium sp. Jales W-56 TaxID=2897325 RepID=UPI0021D17485|nr:hypothetical protein [Undibacterium sp. Jales W-56]MCU6434209.1 hypothetical protein [Undibacterium sp. Jales W-56]